MIKKETNIFPVCYFKTIVEQLKTAYGKGEKSAGHFLLKYNNSIRIKLLRKNKSKDSCLKQDDLSVSRVEGVGVTDSTHRKDSHSMWKMENTPKKNN